MRLSSLLHYRLRASTALVCLPFFGLICQPASADFFAVAAGERLVLPDTGSAVTVFGGNIAETGFLENRGTVSMLFDYSADYNVTDITTRRVNNHGTLYNYGTMTGRTAGGFYNYGLLENRSTGTFGSDTHIMNDNGGTIINSGSMEINWSMENLGTLENRATLYNGGTIRNLGALKHVGALLQNNSGIINLGMMESHGDLINRRLIMNGARTYDNRITAEMRVFGRMENQDEITNTAAWINEKGSKLDNHGTFDNRDKGVLKNYGELNIMGLLDNQKEGVLENYNSINIAENGTFNNYGALTHANYGTLNNTITQNNSERSLILNYGTFNNYGTFTNEPTIRGSLTTDPVIFSSIASYNTFNNYGVFKNSGDLVTEKVVYNSGTIEQREGQLQSFGTLKNEGKITIFSGRLYNFGTLDNYDTIDNKAALANSGTLNNYGTLNNEGTFVNSGGTVNNSGLFYNHGTFINSGTLHNSGRIDETAHISVAGHLRMEEGSAYHISLENGGSSLAVGGSATIDGNLHITSLDSAASYHAPQSYTVITADGGIDGKHDAVHLSSAFLTTDMTYYDNAAHLTVGMHSGVPVSHIFTIAAGTDNQHRTALALGSLPQHGGSLELYNDILMLSTHDALSAFDQLSGEVYASSQSGLAMLSREISSVLNDQLSGGSSDAPVRYWSRALGSWGTLDGDGNASSLDMETGGLLLGGDAMVGDDWRLGVMGGYSQSYFDAGARHGKSSSDSYHLGVYGGREWGALALRSGVNAAWHEVDTSRAVIFPDVADGLRSDHDAFSTQLFGEVGYRMPQGAASEIEPFVNLAHLYLYSDGVSEKGGISALTLDDEDMQITYATLGIHGKHQLTWGDAHGELRGTLGWQHAFGDITPQRTLSVSGSDDYTLRGVPVAQDAAVVGVGLGFALDEASALDVSYQGQFASDADQHGVRAQLRFAF